MFSVTFTVNKGKAHFPFGHDRTDVSNPDSNLITSMGDIAKETITVQSLHSTWTNPNKETIPRLCAGASWIQNWMDCISQPERLIKGIKSRKHEVTAQGCSPELNREHTHGSSIHLSYPPLHIAPFLWEGTQVTTAVLSPGMCITSTAGAPGKALNEGSSNSHLEAEPAPCPWIRSWLSQQLPAEKPQTPTKTRQGPRVTAHMIHSARFRSIIQTQQQQFVLRFPKNCREADKAKWH